MNLISKHTSKLRCAYLVLLVVYTIMREVIPLQSLVGSAILTYGVFGLGLFVISMSLIADKQFLRVNNILLMALFLGACVLSTLVNFRFAFVDNVKAICWMLLFFGLVYPTGNASREKRSKEIIALFGSAVTTMAVFVGISLPMYLFNIDFTFNNENVIGVVSSQGFNADFRRLWGVFCDANTAAVYSAVAIFMAVYLFAKYKNKLLRVLLSVSILIFSLYIVLSGSRTAFLASVLACAWCGLYFAICKKKMNLSRILVAGVCALVSAGICFGAYSFIRVTLPYARRTVGSAMSNDAFVKANNWYERLYSLGNIIITENESFNYNLVQPTEPNVTEPNVTEPNVTEPNVTDPNVTDPNVTDPNVTEPNVTEPNVTEPNVTKPNNTEPVVTEPAVEKLDRVDNDGKDISNGRFTKWFDALEIFAATPIVGASPRGATNFGREHCPDNEISMYGVAAHNFLLEILMGTGIIGFVLAMLILFRSAWLILKKANAEAFSIETLLVGAIAVNLIFASLFLSDLFFVLTFGGAAFWFSLGYLCSEPKVEHEKKDGEKKRVLVYGPKDPVGGVEKIVFDYVRNIVEKHCDISFDFLEYGSNFSMENDIKSIGCRVLYVPSRKNMISYKREMERIFRSTQYIAVWGNYSGLTNIDLLVLAKKYGVPVRIAHSHGSKLYWGSTVMKYIVHILHYYNKYFRLEGYVTDYWACSEMSGKFMFPKSVYNKIDLIPNAVDTDKFCPNHQIGRAVRNQLGIDENALVVGHVARICEVKNQSFLLNVMAEIIKHRPDAKLLFVGDGELRPQIEDKIKELKLQDNVIMTGGRNDVPDLLRSMDVFVLTSFSEGLSVSAVEAQASGLPCVMPTSVSPETNIAGAMTFLSLEEPTEKWAKEIIDAADNYNENSVERIIEGGYGIAVASERLYGKFVSTAN